MEEESGAVLWVLLTLSAVAGLALSSLRCVPRGHRLVVTRRGIVSRVAGPGLLLRIPVADRVALQPTGPEELPLAVHATTRDGTDVRLLATAEVRLPPPQRDRPLADPRRAGGLALEGVLAGWVETQDVASLPGAVRRAWAELVVEAGRAGEACGVEVLGIELDELDAVLTPFDHGPD